VAIGLWSDEFGVDATRLAVAGASVGGNLAAVVSLQAKHVLELEFPDSRNIGLWSNPLQCPWEGGDR